MNISRFFLYKCIRNQIWLCHMVAQGQPRFIIKFCANLVGPTSTMLHTKARKKAKIRNGYNQASHLTQDINGKVTTSQLDITKESQKVSPFPGDHKASTNRRSSKHNKTRQKYHKWSTREARPWNDQQKYFAVGLKPVKPCTNFTKMWIKTHR